MILQPTNFALNAANLRLGATSSPADAVICTKICKDFGGGEASFRVLHDVDISFKAGELSMLVGPSGCGKTTLISIIAGILQATSGEVKLFDQPLRDLHGADLVRFRLKNIGFIFQQYNLLPSLTAAENAALALAAGGVPRKSATEIAAEMLARLGMAEQIHKFPSQLSGGQQQRVAIARALVHNPRLIVCDEPTAALDAASGHRVMELLSEIAIAPGRACVIVTHDNRIFNFADRVVEMVDGHISSVVDDGNPKTRAIQH